MRLLVVLAMMVCAIISTQGQAPQANPTCLSSFVGCSATQYVNSGNTCASTTCLVSDCCLDNLCSFTDSATNNYKALACDTSLGNLATGDCVLVCRPGFKGSVTATCNIDSTAFDVTDDCVVANDIMVIANPTYEGRYKHIFNDPSVGEVYRCEANGKTLQRTQDVNGKLNGWKIGTGASALCAKSAVETPVNVLGHWSNCQTGAAVQLSLYVYQPHVWAHRRRDGEGPWETCDSFDCSGHPRRPLGANSKICPHDGCTFEHCCVATCAGFDCGTNMTLRPSAASVTCPTTDREDTFGCTVGRCCAFTCQSAINAGAYTPSCFLGLRPNLNEIVCHRTGCTNGRCCQALKCPSANDATGWAAWCDGNNQVPDYSKAGTYTPDQTGKNPADCCTNKLCKDMSTQTCADGKVWTDSQTDQCATAPCGNTDATCCVNPKCSANPKSCTVDDKTWTDSLTLRCGSAACANDDTACCVPKFCADDVKTCADDKVWDITTANLRCANAPCAYNDGTCCVKATCVNIAGKNCDGLTRKHWISSLTDATKCAGDVCGNNDPNCCVANPYCADPCTPGSTHPNPSQQCAGATCGTNDNCCLANPTCSTGGYASDANCGARKHLKANIANSVCSGATCDVDECCDDNDKCSDANSLFKSDLLCRQTVPGTHLKDAPLGGFPSCTTLHCSHEQCCEANPTCHGKTQAFCGDGKHLNNNLDHVVCLTGTCTPADCCWVNPTCSEYKYDTAQCSTFNMAPASNLNIPCVTTTCDQTDCCQATP